MSRSRPIRGCTDLHHEFLPASTTHRQLSPEEQATSGVTQNLMRWTIGLEHVALSSPTSIRPWPWPSSWGAMTLESGEVRAGAFSQRVVSSFAQGNSPVEAESLFERSNSVNGCFHQLWSLAEFTGNDRYGLNPYGWFRKDPASTLHFAVSVRLFTGGSLGTSKAKLMRTRTDDTSRAELSDTRGVYSR